jgi:hypothetical protein
MYSFALKVPQSFLPGGDVSSVFPSELSGRRILYTLRICTVYSQRELSNEYLVKEPSRENDFGHWEQLKGFSPV